ncbi:tat (twin-arginine translocation) pathway signal sequence [Burkholderia sp. 22PA0099]|uniref:tat (twin-arginine translocation) pathway signal sequence n=1 Tax=Burkholderia sp. 22PA0099 TaxID=3237372 RepID=UPI0039C1645A
MEGKTIGIVRERQAEADGPRRIALTRREWLKGTGVLIGTLALSSSLAAFAPSRVWAIELQGLDSHTGAVLLALVKQIYPHATLDDAVYALVVKDLDAKARKDAATRTQLAAGARQLDAKSAGGDWAHEDAAAQAKDTAAIAGTPFFETVRSTAVVSLYSNGLAYRHFGYGAAQGDGGYLFQGFDDLSWLPDPAPQDSGPVPAA